MSEETLPPAFDKNGKFIDYCIGDRVPMFKVEEDTLIAYYEITALRKQRGGDWLYDSDAYHYDLKFDSLGIIIT